MANLQVRDIDDLLYHELKNRAREQHRSLSQEVVHIIEEYLSRPPVDSRTQTDLFLQLAGSWQGSETADVIIKSIRKARVNSRRFRTSHGISN